MKERFWFVYYWVMLSYVYLGVLVLIISLLTYQDRALIAGLECDTNIYSGKCSQGNNVPSLVRDINQVLYFDFIDYGSIDGKLTYGYGGYNEDFIRRGISLDRYIDFNNGYPLLLILLLTLIRWISIGKHIWQRP